MRIFIIGPTNYGYSKSVVSNIQNAGNEVKFFPMNEFYTSVSYCKRKLYKLGIKSLKERYNINWEHCLLREYNNFQPEYTLFLNGSMCTANLLKKLRISRNILWLWDGIVRFGAVKLQSLAPYFDTIAVFEYDDILEIRKYYHKKLIYLPLGYDEGLYPSLSKSNRDIDISFIGMPTKERLEICNQIAEFSKRRNLKFFLGGEWYSRHWPWKRLQFRFKYPTLYSCLENRILSLSEVAKIYQRSKICINISVGEHKSINPRTFEILASGALEIINMGQKSYGRVRVGKDLLEYRNINDLLNKIEYYLRNEKERAAIAQIGYRYNKAHNSMRIAIERLLSVIVSNK